MLLWQLSLLLALVCVMQLPPHELATWPLLASWLYQHRLAQHVFTQHYRYTTPFQHGGYLQQLYCRELLLRSGTSLLCFHFVYVFIPFTCHSPQVQAGQFEGGCSLSNFLHCSCLALTPQPMSLSRSCSNNDMPAWYKHQQNKNDDRPKIPLLNIMALKCGSAV